MRRVFPWCVALAALILIVFPIKQQSRAGDVGRDNLKGTYAFTLTETCVHQRSVNIPGFNSSFQIVDPAGAETYCGASDGLMVFDGKGGASIEQGRATNVMNAQDRLVPPFLTNNGLPTGTPVTIPLGFGLGPALPFTCTGTYTVKDGNIAAPLTCNAVISFTNVLGTTGFQSTFTLEGFVPEHLDHLLLTDIGNTVQPVTIFFPGSPPFSVQQQRVCTRSATLVRVSSE